MKVYALTEGEYSDYKIVAMFSTREKAEECQKLLARCSSDVEEYELDSLNNPHPGLFQFQIVITKDGDAKALRLSSFDDRSDRKPQPLYSDDPRLSVRVSFYVFAKDEQHAIKIANEKRVQLIAQNEWPEIGPGKFIL